MTIHLPRGGSTATRSMNCPGWLVESANIPPRPAGQAAIDGSMHHMIMEECQKHDKHPEECIGMVYKENGVERQFTEDDLDLSEIAYNATNNLMEDLDIEELMVEPFVQAVEGLVGGSIDLLGLSADKKTLMVLDYKFGSVKVPVTKSDQHFLYTISAFIDEQTADLFEYVEKVVFVIVQPRAAGTVFTWDCEVNDVVVWWKKFQEQIKKDTLSAGSHCKYCPAEPYCSTKRASVMGDNLLGKDLKDALQEAADKVDEVEAWVKAVKEELYLQMTRGVSVNGWKIVEKRPTTKWTDADAAAKFLKSKRIPAKAINNPAKLKTPKQIEAVLKKRKRSLDLEEFTVTESSGTTIATADDTREAVLASDIQGHLKTMMN